jgi:DNA polymerase-3 subunit delta
MPTEAFTVICGSDDFLVAREGQQAWAELTRDVTDDFQREIIDGAANNVDETEKATASFIAAVRTLPLFGDRKYVWFKNLSFLGDTALGRTEGAKEQVEKLMGALESSSPADVGILITASPVDRRRREFKWLQSNTKLNFLAAEKEAGAASLLEDELRREQLRISPEAAHALLEKINHNTRLALEETRKLALYAGPGAELTLEMVNLLVPPYGDGDSSRPRRVFFTLDLQATLDASTATSSRATTSAAAHLAPNAPACSSSPRAVGRRRVRSSVSKASIETPPPPTPATSTAPTTRATSTSSRRTPTTSAAHPDGP